MVKNDEEADKLANDAECGLMFAVSVTDLARVFEFAREIEGGAIHINSPTHNEPVPSHGGVKAKGCGTFSFKDCLDKWTRTKVVTWQE